jgi:uncharacterized membrane protein (DUF4010 family)
LPALQRLGVAVLIGMLIGLDRERSDLSGQRLLFAGVRTFPIIALAGALPQCVPGPAGIILLIAGFIAVAAITVVSYAHSAAHGESGATTEIAALVTFMLGAVAGSGEMVIAGAVGVGVAVLLASKLRLESLSRALAPEELAAVLELAVISVIVLPLLPRRGYGPWSILNPFEIWLVVVLVTALSFAGFVAMRILGERRGLTVTGIIGGMVSSTAVTLAMAGRSRDAGPGAASSSAAAVILASTVMCVRVAVLAGIVGAGILPRLLPVVVVMGIVGFVAARLVMRRASGHGSKPARPLGNPFRLRAAILFAAIYVLVRVAVHAAQVYFGEAGMFGAAFLASLADVDAPTIAFARGGMVDDSWRGPAAAVAIAMVGNTGVKIALAAGLGAGVFRRHVALALVAMGIAGGVVAALVYVRG